LEIGGAGLLQQWARDADIYALPASVRRDCDVALITVGVLNWMPDLPRFLREVARCSALVGG
jgi:hypothetical protein